MSEFHSQNIFIPGYDEVKVSTGKLARNTDGSVLIEAGNIVLLATVVYCEKILQQIFSLCLWNIVKSILPLERFLVDF